MKTLRCVILVFGSLSGYFFHPPETFAQEVVALEDLVDARRVAERITQEWEATPAVDRKPYFVFHVGPVSEAMSWLYTTLTTRGVEIHFDRITGERWVEELERNEKHAAGSYLRLRESGEVLPEGSEESTKTLFALAKERARRFWGLSAGISVFFRFEKDHWPTRKEQVMSLLQGGLAAGSSVLTLVLAPKNQDPRITLAAVGLGLWVCGWHAFKRVTNELFFGFGKAARVTAGGGLQERSNYPWAYVTRAALSTASNFLFVGLAYGVDYMFSGEALARNINNTIVGLYARGWIEDWLRWKQPSPKNPNAWSMGWWIAVTSIWSTFYGLTKNLNLISPSIMDYVYYTLGTIGVLRFIKIERFTFWNFVERHAPILFRREKQCDALLVRGR